MSAYTIMDWIAVNGNQGYDIGVAKPLLHNELFLVIPFKTIKGMEYRRRKLIAKGAVGARAINENFPVTKDAYGEYVTELTILGGQAQIDEELFDSGELNLLYEDVVNKLASIGEDFQNRVINGDRRLDPKDFNGLKVSLGEDASQTILSQDAPNGATFTKKDIERLIALIEGGANTLVMNPKMKVVVKTELEKLITYYNINELTKTLEMYGSAKIISVPESVIPITETCGTSNDTTSIYALRIEDVTGVFGIAKTALPVVEENVRKVDQQYLKGVSWRVGIACPNVKTIGRLRGIKLA